MTGNELNALRLSKGLSKEELSELLELGPNGSILVYCWEDYGEERLPIAVSPLMELYFGLRAPYKDKAKVNRFAPMYPTVSTRTRNLVGRALNISSSEISKLTLPELIDKGLTIQRFKQTVGAGKTSLIELTNWAMSEGLMIPKFTYRK